MARYVVKFARRALLSALFVTVAALGAATGLVFVFAEDLPEISALDNYAPSATTRVAAADGQVIGEFAVMRRDVVPYEHISPLLRQAILASEDDQFESHVGLNWTRILLTLAKDVVEGRRAGGSTITQQLAKNLFLTPEKTWSRKVREAMLAVQIEKRFTKQEIFTLYANTVPFGHGAYGVEAAARLYFDKSARDVTLEEAALIAGIIQAPSRQSPYVGMENALRRRNYALGRMAAVGYITDAAAVAAMKTPIVTAGQIPDESIAPYFLEEVRQHLEARYGAKALYEGALAVQTTLDRHLQEIANHALDGGLRRLDKRHGYRKPTRNVAATGKSVRDYQDPAWRRPLRAGAVVPAVVIGAEDRRLVVRVGARSATIDPAGYAWTRRKDPAEVGKPGDLVAVRVTDPGSASTPLVVTLDQDPIVQGAMLVIENHTGHVKAMVGGFDFDQSKFNRTVQAKRQIGSTVKAFVYTAAIDRGYTPVSILVDEPVTYSAGAGQPPYAPSNYDLKFEGPITLRHAFEGSRNIPAVKMTDALGPSLVVEYAHRFGLQSPIEPYLSLALGAGEATLMEMTSAFSVFPNQGVRMYPSLVSKVTDRQGDVLEENHPESADVIRADTAYILTSLLRGVVQRGTAGSAASLKWTLAGKTGTTNDYTDAWMIGFDPDITVGVWVGHDLKKTLGNGESGAVAALPIWIDFWKQYIEGKEPPEEFAAPGNIVQLTVDRHSGQQTVADAPGAIKEVFISGTQPMPTFTRTTASPVGQSEQP